MFNVCKVKLLLVAILSLSVSSVFAAPPEWVEGQLIVKPKAGLSDAQFEKILSKSKGAIGQAPEADQYACYQGAARRPWMRSCGHCPTIRILTMSKRTCWWHPTPSRRMTQATPASGICRKSRRRPPGSTSTGSGITVAILDTGVEGSHPDLVNNLVPGWNVVSNNSDTSPVMSHGTSVAGTVAATGNNATRCCFRCLGREDHADPDHE